MLADSDSGSFFDASYFDRWLVWVRTSAHSNESARLLNRWLDLQRAGLVSTIDSYRASYPDRVPVRLLDVGCGNGEYSVSLVIERNDVAVHGIDVSATLVASANMLARRSKVDSRAEFTKLDAADLQCGELDPFDIVYGVTNVLGNMPLNVQRHFLQGLHAVLQRQGQVFLSVYSDGSTAARLESYLAVGLSVRDEDDRFVAREGLMSQSFSRQQIIDLMTRHGLRLISGPTLIAGIGWQIVAILDEPSVEVREHCHQSE